MIIWEAHLYNSLKTQQRIQELIDAFNFIQSTFDSLVTVQFSKYLENVENILIWVPSCWDAMMYTRGHDISTPMMDSTIIKNVGNVEPTEHFSQLFSKPLITRSYTSV